MFTTRHEQTNRGQTRTVNAFTKHICDFSKRTRKEREEAEVSSKCPYSACPIQTLSPRQLTNQPLHRQLLLPRQTDRWSSVPHQRQSRMEQHRLSSAPRSLTR